MPFELIEQAIRAAVPRRPARICSRGGLSSSKTWKSNGKFAPPPKNEEYKNYHGRMSDKWLRRLAALGTDEHKPFLEIAPYLIVGFHITSNAENGETEPTTETILFPRRFRLDFTRSVMPDGSREQGCSDYQKPDESNDGVTA